MISILEFDFDRKQDRSISIEEVVTGNPARFFWVDVQDPSDAEATNVLSRLHISAAIQTCIRTEQQDDPLDAGEEGLSFCVREASIDQGGFETHRTVIFMTGDFLLTWHRKEAGFLRGIRQTVHEDFVKFSRSPGFLLYEIGAHLVVQHRRVLGTVSRAVDTIQKRIFATTDDLLFAEAAAWSDHIGGFRQVLLDTRDLLHELATRRSSFIPETTLPTLERLSAGMERLIADLGSEREMLNDTLNLHMGIVGFRTNRIVTRLTALSVIFLPLTFLCGVYGMNFEYLPELSWRHGYAAFWAVVSIIAGLSVIAMRKARWW